MCFDEQIRNISNVNLQQFCHSAHKFIFAVSMAITVLRFLPFFFFLLMIITKDMQLYYFDYFFFPLIFSGMLVTWEESLTIWDILLHFYFSHTATPCFTKMLGINLWENLIGICLLSSYSFPLLLPNGRKGNIPDHLQWPVSFSWTHTQWCPCFSIKTFFFNANELNRKRSPLLWLHSWLLK